MTQKISLNLYGHDTVKTHRVHNKVLQPKIAKLLIKQH
jgi:hypothetical protein